MAVTLLRKGDEWTLSLSEELQALDTAATQLLLALQRSLAADGRVLRFEGTPPQVADLWRHAGLGDRLG